MDNFNIDEAPFYLGLFLSFNNIPVLFDHGLFCLKKNNENGAFLFGISGYEMFLPRYHYNKLYLVMYLVVRYDVST